MEEVLWGVNLEKWAFHTLCELSHAHTDEQP